MNRAFDSKWKSHGGHHLSVTGKVRYGGAHAPNAARLTGTTRFVERATRETAIAGDRGPSGGLGAIVHIETLRSLYTARMASDRQEQFIRKMFMCMSSTWLSLVLLREAAAVRSARYPGSDGGNGGSFGSRTHLRG